MTYQFKAMLGPPEEWPIGSAEWAERIGQRLQITLNRIDRTESHKEREFAYLPPVLDAVLDVVPRPWTVWPSDNPCRTSEAWFQAVTGEPIKSIVKLVQALDPESPLIRKLQAAEAEDNPAGKEEGGRPKRGTVPRLRANEHSRLSTKRILARLARDRPDVLAAFKTGEYKSARAAAIAAGFIKPPSHLEIAIKAYAKLSPDEQREFWHRAAVTEAAE